MHQIWRAVGGFRRGGVVMSGAGMAGNENGAKARMRYWRGSNMGTRP